MYNPCGNITISNVTVYAYSAMTMASSPGIGSYAACGTIAIDNATVYARGTGADNMSCTAIGSNQTLQTITISDSDIYAYRGTSPLGTSYADWIGKGGESDGYSGGDIQSTIMNTTVHKGMWNGISETSEDTVWYGADSAGTEQ